jgi:hypothetical protein
MVQLGQGRTGQLLHGGEHWVGRAAGCHPGRTGLDGDGGQLMCHQVMQFTGDPGAFRLVGRFHGGGGFGPPGTGRVA